MSRILSSATLVTPIILSFNLFALLPISGESSRLLSTNSLSNSSLNNGYISDNGPLNANNNNSVACSSGYASVNLAGYTSSDSEGGRGRDGGGRGGAGGAGEWRRSSGRRGSSGFGASNAPLPRPPASYPRPATGTSMELVNLGPATHSVENGFQNPLEGMVPWRRSSVFKNHERDPCIPDPTLFRNEWRRARDAIEYALKWWSSHFGRRRWHYSSQHVTLSPRWRGNITIWVYSTLILEAHNDVRLPMTFRPNPFFFLSRT